MPVESDLLDTLLAIERTAMDRWGQGDPGGFLEISAEDVSYFDPFQERRLDGHYALTELYEKLRGQARIDRYEFVNPRVQVCGETAVLTYNFASSTKFVHYYWNTTEVYRKTDAGWRIVHTHWSLPQKA